jgi:hypothetical protein
MRINLAEMHNLYDSILSTPLDTEDVSEEIAPSPESLVLMKESAQALHAMSTGLAGMIDYIRSSELSRSALDRAVEVLNLRFVRLADPETYAFSTILPLQRANLVVRIANLITANRPGNSVPVEASLEILRYMESRDPESPVRSSIVQNLLPAAAQLPKETQIWLLGIARKKEPRLWSIASLGRVPASLLGISSFSSAETEEDEAASQREATFLLQPTAQLTSDEGLTFVQVTLPKETTAGAEVELQISDPESGAVLYSNRRVPELYGDQPYVVWPREDITIIAGADINLSEVDITAFVRLP